MRKRGKVAVTVSAAVLAEAERERKRTGESRSAVFERALTMYFADGRAVEAARKYVDGLVRVATAAASAAFSAEPWDAEG
jgi:metal-responsive CopG/Arc/MetJ family transcriptional regulator